MGCPSAVAAGCCGNASRGARFLDCEPEPSGTLLCGEDPRADDVVVGTSPVINEASYVDLGDGTLLVQIPFLAFGYFGPSQVTLVSLDPGAYRKKRRTRFTCNVAALEFAGLRGEVAFVDEPSPAISVEHPVGFVYYDGGKVAVAMIEPMAPFAVPL